MVLVRFLVVLSIIDISVALSFSSKDDLDLLGRTGEAMGAVLGAASQPRCFVIFLTDGTTPPYTVFKVVDEVRTPWGVGVFEVAADGQDANVTQAQLSRVVGQASRLRQQSWCVTVVVVSDDPAFLAAFAEWSLKGRLLVWSTRLLTITHLPLLELRDILSSHWTFSMMNAMLLIFDDTPNKTRCVVYSHMPYSPRGAETVPVASWSLDRGLSILPNQRLYPDKFTKCEGQRHWVTLATFFLEYEERTAAGNTVKKYNGPDGLMFVTVANTLNFTFRFLPVSDWTEAADRVVERKSIMLVVSHVLLHTRAKRYDYTYSYTFASFGFGLAKPVLKPQWQSLYYPLADEVWASTLAALLLMPALMYTVSLRNNRIHEDGRQRRKILGPVTSGYSLGGRGVGTMIQEAFGTLLGQNLSKWLPRASSSRVLVATWLVFAFILGTVYRGNLTAALTLPKYPPRPETVEELVNYADRVTMPPYGKDWQKQFRESGSTKLERLANLMDIGPTILEGLQMALKKKQAHLTTRQAFSHWTAEHLTRADGSVPLYFGRENIVPGACSWPIPHDAPYKPHVDNIMMAVKEAGLYDKWAEDSLEETRRESRAKRKEERDKDDTGGPENELELASSTINTNRALTIVHMQGPLMLLLLGLMIAIITLISEILTSRCCH